MKKMKKIKENNSHHQSCNITQYTPPPFARTRVCDTTSFRIRAWGMRLSLFKKLFEVERIKERFSYQFSAYIAQIQCSICSINHERLIGSHGGRKFHANFLKEVRRLRLRALDKLGIWIALHHIDEHSYPCCSINGKYTYAHISLSGMWYRDRRFKSFVAFF